MHHLKWLALPIAALGFVLLFFGLVWMAPLPAAPGGALLIASAGLWRVTSGNWPLALT